MLNRLMFGVKTMNEIFTILKLVREPQPHLSINYQLHKNSDKKTSSNPLGNGNTIAKVQNKLGCIYTNYKFPSHSQKFNDTLTLTLSKTQLSIPTLIFFYIGSCKLFDLLVVLVTQKLNPMIHRISFSSILQG